MFKSKKMKNRDNMPQEEFGKILDDNPSFAVAEAYKLLRTNLNFTLPAVEGCKIIGVTSALKGEGKSTTSVNIAYTMAQSGQKVLLLEADMRLPTLVNRIRVQAKPGLSNLLAGQCKGNDIVQSSGLLPNLWVATAGDVPPNPAELLGTKNMSMTIDALAKVFDIIIVDLPPVTAVADAAVVSKLVHGMVVVVRKDYCDGPSLHEAVRQLEFAGSKILGFVMIGAKTHSQKYQNYSNYGYYKKNPASAE